MSQSNHQSTLWDTFKQLASVLVLFIVLKTSIVEAYKIPSQSMEDTLLVGDFLIANKFVYGARIPLVDWRLPAIDRPEPGDVVIFLFPGDGVTKYIKRCVAGPGDRVEVRNKILYVNNIEIDLPPHGKHGKTGGSGPPPIMAQGLGDQGRRDNFGPYVVPENSFFMMGDNRDNSFDSRFWGAVPYDMVLGEALLVHWSWDDSIHSAPDVSITDPLSVPRLYVHDAIHFFQKVRWSRLLNLIS